MFLNDWKNTGLIGMISDFEGISMSPEEYLAEVSPWANEGMWRESKRRMAEAIESERYKDIEVLIASYTYEDYLGDAFVLYRKDGKLYEVNGSHCSCYGLSALDYSGDETSQTSQWQPEETSVDALLQRLEHDKWEFDGMRDELRQVLTSLA